MMTTARSPAPLTAGALSRRAFLAGLSVTTLAACAGTMGGPDVDRAAIALMYGPMPDERFPIPAFDMSEVDPRYVRQQVAYTGTEPVGSMVIQTARFLLYYVDAPGRAWRYGIGVGLAGLELEGDAYVGRKAEWPSWRPTEAMIAREPERYEPYRNGLPPGLTSPLGPRAFYLYRDGRDTLFRIHGSTEVWSIGTRISSGCIRLFHHDVIHLYDRAPVGTEVRVLALDDARPRDTQG